MPLFIRRLRAHRVHVAPGPLRIGLRRCAPNHRAFGQECCHRRRFIRKRLHAYLAQGFTLGGKRKAAHFFSFNSMR